MPTSAQSGAGLLERRIIELLTTTNLTFKEIILKLGGENLSASIGTIRRINRDNRYRRPRYDSKLTPAQRESLVEELRDHQGVKPNLSLLAKRYGVCHGSVWYWWDKLNRVRRCDPHLNSSSFRAKGLFKRSHQMQLMASSGALRQPDASGELERLAAAAASAREPVLKQQAPLNFARDQTGHIEPLDVAPAGRLSFVGRVSVVRGAPLGEVELPILMFASSATYQQDPWLVKGAADVFESSLAAEGEPEAPLALLSAPGGVGGDLGGMVGKMLEQRAGAPLPPVKAGV